MARAIGLDISKYQAPSDFSKPVDIDFKTMLSKIDFLVVRAGYAGSAGGAWTDERVHEYMALLEPLLLENPHPFTFYWYFRDDVSAGDQANRFSTVVNKYKEVVNLPLVLDAEVFVKGTKDSTNDLIYFQAEVEKQTGLLVDILYARSWQLNEETVPGLELVLPMIMLARYNNEDPQTGEPWNIPPDDPMLKPRDYDVWTFWQYSETGDASAYGVGPTGSKSIDEQVFNGTVEELRKLAKLDEPLPPPIDWEKYGVASAEEAKFLLADGEKGVAYFNFTLGSQEPLMVQINAPMGSYAQIGVVVDGVYFRLRKAKIGSSKILLHVFPAGWTLNDKSHVQVNVTGKDPDNVSAIRVRYMSKKYQTL